MKGFSKSIQSLLCSDFKLFSVVKPGSTTNTLSESMVETINQLTHNDILVVSCGTNDCELNNFKFTFRNIKNFLSNRTNTNIVLLSIPFRYDIHNCTSVNHNIKKINKKLNILTKTSPSLSFIDLNNDGKLFTRHGLHQNKLGKNLLSTQIANHVLSIFCNNDATPLYLEWYDTLTEQKHTNLSTDTGQIPIDDLDDNTLTIDVNQSNIMTRHSCHIKKIQ